MEAITAPRKKIVKYVKSIPGYICPNCKKKLIKENGSYICDICGCQIVFKIKVSSLDD